VSGIVVTPTNLSMTLGETQKLTCTITPEDATDKSVTWSTNAPSLASVDQDGTVHALGYGGAVITATTTDGNITAACMVTIPNK